MVIEKGPSLCQAGTATASRASARRRATRRVLIPSPPYYSNTPERRGTRSDQDVPLEGSSLAGRGRPGGLALQLPQQRLEELHRQAGDVRPRSVDAPDQGVVLLADRVASRVLHRVRARHDLLDRRVVLQGDLRGDELHDPEAALLQDDGRAQGVRRAGEGPEEPDGGLAVARLSVYPAAVRDHRVRREDPFGGEAAGHRVG